MAKKKTTKTQAQSGKTKKDSEAGKAKPKKGAKGGLETKDKKLSALDAAAKVLEETNQAMTCQELIEAMAARGYWTSPAGRTPQATLYAAMARDIATKGTKARFQKTERGKFARNSLA